jgi:hypothetical protein
VGANDLKAAIFCENHKHKNKKISTNENIKIPIAINYSFLLYASENSTANAQAMMPRHAKL